MRVTVVFIFSCLILDAFTLDSKKATDNVKGTKKSEKPEPTIVNEESKKNQAWNSRPFHSRSRDHLEQSFHIHSPLDKNHQDLNAAILERLKIIYQQSVKPLEDAYKFKDITHYSFSEGDIYAQPKITFIGPWSTGKTSMINYLLGIEDNQYSLASGAVPTTTDFTILVNGDDYKTIDGMVLELESSYSHLKKFGHRFLEKLKTIKLPSKFLQKVTVIDTPGIIENQKQRERGYPFNEVCQWFLSHSEMIIVIFDPTKLDVGMELEQLFKHLKGYEPKVRIILNKADTLEHQELMKVYGALFWNLSPLINVTEPPRVYVGSFWSRDFNPESDTSHQFFQQEEVSLLKDLYEEVANAIENKIVALRQHALYVRNHAILVDHFLNTLYVEKSFFKNTKLVTDQITANPKQFISLKSIAAQKDISVHDFFDLDKYTGFFESYSLSSFKYNKDYCGYISSCYIDLLNKAINNELPELLKQLHEVRGEIKARKSSKEDL